MKTCLNKCQPVTMSSTYGDAKKYYRCMYVSMQYQLCLFFMHNVGLILVGAYMYRAICAFSTADQGCDVVLDEEESKEIQ